MSFHLVHALRSAGAALFLLLAIGLPITSGAQNQSDELIVDSVTAAQSLGWATTDDGRVQVLVEMTEPSEAVVYARAIAGKSPRDKNVKSAAATATQAVKQRIDAQQQSVSRALSSAGASEIYRVARALNGIAVAIVPSQLAQLRRISGVLRVLPIPRETPTLSTSVPFLGVPNLWENSIGLPNALTGAGMRIGIIDTGIDYLHSDFGGSGLLADYQANDTTTNSDNYFPTAKVVGGTDFAGDAYTGSNAPAPDADPMDCYGHGTHVAGIAAGQGVNSDGSTYTGAYSNATPFAGLRIGPGVAPQASLYAIRIFGCTGSTSLTVQGIDWALDPNGDNDLSDHLDVINMSLGSTFGNYNTSSALASENAAATGMIVVAAAGNSGDTYFITGSPGVSGRTISVAASVDPESVAAVLVINAPAGIAGAYAAAGAGFTPAPPAPSGQTADVVQALDAADAAGPSTTDGCSPFTNTAAMAGNIALIDRGTCGFILKVQNAQAAGAIGAIVVGNVVGDSNLTVMGGAAPPGPAVTIPSVYISLADGNTIKAQLNGVNATLNAATAADTMASFSSRGPRLGDIPTRMKPDISAPGLNITSAQSGKTCSTGGGCITPTGTGYDAGSLALTISGTSMAAPHMAGVMALLLQLHPDWSVEQLKAAAMNGALHDVTIGANGSGPRYGASREGAGRVDPSNSAVATVVALNDEDSGAVSVSFETDEVVSTATEQKRVRLVNTGVTPATYDLSIDTVDDAPGVTFSVPGSSTVTVPASDSTEFDVQMDAVGALMKHVKEVTVAPTQAAPAPLTSLGSLARHWLTEESGFLVLSQGGVTKLRVPLYVVTRAASTMSAAPTITTGGANTGSTTMALTGTQVCTGTLSAGPVCNGAAPTDETSLVTPLELQVVSAQDLTVAPAFADIQYGGVAYDPATNLVLFGVSTWGDWATPTDVAFNIYIDNNSDGTYDRILFNTNPGTAAASLFGTAGAVGQDSFITLVFNLATSGVSTGNFVNRASAAAVDSVLFKNNVMFLAATPASLGLAAGTTKFKYKIQTCPGFAPLCGPVNGFHYDEAAGPFTYDYAAANQGVNFGGTNLTADLNGGSIPVTWNLANMTANGSKGALLLHHHNRRGQRAQVVTLEGTPNTDLAITQSVSAPAPALGANVTYTVQLVNNGPSAATAVQVTDLLPVGMTYVSDDAGGAYDPASGTWTAGSIAVTAAATLHIVATVGVTDKTCNTSQITASTPLDINPANDSATTCVMAPRSTDLALSMTVSSPTTVAGGNVTYTLTVKNNGADTAYSLDVQNAFPAFPTLHATSATPSQGTYDSSTGLWNIGSLADGASATLAIIVVAPNTAGALTNQGTATSGTSDPNTVNNSASATTIVLSPATLSGTKSVSGSFRPGGTVTYTVTLVNSSASDQQDNPGNEFTDVLSSADLTLVSASASAGTAVGNLATNTVTWNGVVPGNGSVVITISATVNSSTPGHIVSNQGSISYDSDGNGTNDASAQTNDPTVGGSNNPTSFTVASPASLSASKTVAGSFTPGGHIVYTVVITNAGPNAQADNPGHEFVDNLPATLNMVSASANSGTTAVSGNTVSWDGSIAAGNSVTVTIDANIALSSGGQTIVNQGTVSFDADGNGTNESSVATDDPSLGGAADATSFTVASPAMLSATKSVTGTFSVGGNVTYAVVISNSSTSAQADNPGHEFTDVLPPQLTVLNATANAGTTVMSGNTVTWDGAVPAGGSVTVSIIAKINANAAGQTISNQGSLSFDADGNGTNESSAVTDDPATQLPNDPTSFSVAATFVPPIPAPMLDRIGMLLLAVLLAMFGFFMRGKRRFDRR